ncbi:MAG: glycosyltransferase family 2 protein [Candidatus Omnitrophota bacterium]
MKEQPLVSVIIVNYNGKKYLKNCFDSLLQGLYANIEIILVDNGSSDGSVEFVGDAYKNVQLLDLKNNFGLAIASNKGAEIAKGEYLFFFNNDTVADSNLITRLVEAVKEDSEIGIAGCKTYTYDGKCLINSGVACDIFGYPYGNGQPFYVDAGIFIRKQLFEKIGRFDEKLFLYGEDRDICWRAWLYGYKVKVVDDAKFFHDSACITENIKNYRTSINRRFCSEFNALRTILKSYSVLFLILVLPLFFLLNFLEVIIFFFTGQFNVIKNVYLKSYRENFNNLRDTLALRAKIQKERKISDFSLWKHMLKVSGKIKLFLDMGVPKFNERVKYAKN